MSSLAAALAFQIAHKKGLQHENQGKFFPAAEYIPGDVLAKSDFLDSWYGHF